VVRFIKNPRCSEYVCKTLRRPSPFGDTTRARALPANLLRIPVSVSLQIFRSVQVTEVGVLEPAVGSVDELHPQRSVSKQVRHLIDAPSEVELESVQAGSTINAAERMEASVGRTRDYGVVPFGEFEETLQHDIMKRRKVAGQQEHQRTIAGLEGGVQAGQGSLSRIQIGERRQSEEVVNIGIVRGDENLVGEAQSQLGESNYQRTTLDLDQSLVSTHSAALPPGENYGAQVRVSGVPCIHDFLGGPGSIKPQSRKDAKTRSGLTLSQRGSYT
jgi:hypothetical protein